MSQMWKNNLLNNRTEVTLIRKVNLSTHRRRQENVDAEAASMFIAYNFKRLLSMFSTEELVTKFEESVM